MIVATWNVNSIRMRIERLQHWLEQKKPDILCLQETKVVNEDFPVEPFGKLGYRCYVHGQKSYNGVAILARIEAVDLVKGLPDKGADAPCRLIAATFGGVRIINAYAPNGGEVGSDKYAYKLEWYRRLRAFLDSSLTPEDEVLICGDFNVAPEDRDVWDPEKWRGQILFSEPEKEALKHLLAWGLSDALRLHHQESGLYTWWDYREGAFHRGWGVRIDHVLLSPPLARRCSAVQIDREERKGQKPSDHAPVIAVFS
jgi:exodeoxyribonuclease III